MAPPGDIFAGSHAPNAPAHSGDESPEFVVVGEAPGFVAMGQAPEVVAVGYARTSPGLAQVARLANHLPWYLLLRGCIHLSNYTYLYPKILVRRY